MSHLLLLAVACATDSNPTTSATAGTAHAAPAAQAARGAGGDPSPDTVVVTWEGGQLTWGELEEKVRSDLVQAEIEYLQKRYNLLKGAAMGQAVQAVVEAEAARQGITTDELIDREVRQKVTPPTDAEIRSVYPMLKSRLGNRPLEQVRDQVAQALMGQRMQQRQNAWIDELVERFGIEEKVPYPDLPRLDVSVDDDPVKGAADAPVTIVEFADYQCPYCRKANATVDRILEDYGDKVRLVFRDYPLSFHDRAIPAAVAANCAGEQGRYWEMHDILMDPATRLDDAALEVAAGKAGLDVAKWKACTADPDAQKAEIDADMEAGSKLGVQGTPAFFINGIFVNGARPYDEFKAIIDRELASR